MVEGTVREWHDELGWGVLDSPATPGGCWAHASSVHVPGHRALSPGAVVRFTAEPVAQDGYAHRAVDVWPGDVPMEPAPLAPPRAGGGPGAAYRSALVLGPDAGEPRDARLDDAAAGVRAAAEARAEALAAGDPDRLTALLHADYRWTTHRGTVLDRAAYVRGNTDGSLRWLEQRLADVDVRVVGTTAVLTCVAHDRVVRDGTELTFTMPVTQTWVLTGPGWSCLAGHAGPVHD